MEPSTSFSEPSTSGLGRSGGGPPKRMRRESSSNTDSEYDSDVEAEMNNLSSNDSEIEEEIEELITFDDMTNPDGASESYWQIIAERDQVSLDKTLKEQEDLKLTVEELREEYELYKQMLEEANCFVEVIKEEFGSDNDDTGVDVNDVSTADETQDRSNETINNTSNSATSKNGK